MLISHMQNVVRHAKPKHETDGEEHSESPNEQQSKYSAREFYICTRKQNLHWISAWHASMFHVSHDFLSLQ